jgi:hypothetical protein
MICFVEFSGKIFVVPVIDLEYTFVAQLPKWKLVSPQSQVAFRGIFLKAFDEFEAQLNSEITSSILRFKQSVLKVRYERQSNDGLSREIAKTVNCWEAETEEENRQLADYLDKIKLPTTIVIKTLG